MPMDRARYPADWEAISQRIRERADNRCEWCGAPNKHWIVRSPVEPRVYRVVTEGEERWPGRWVFVVLTVHHIGIDREDGTPGDPHDKHDCRDANLTALCQRCHLLADLPLHMANAAATRRRKRVEAGQREMVFP